MAITPTTEATSPPGWRQRVDFGLLFGMECLVLAQVVLSPWAFGAVDPRWEFWLYLGSALLLALWAIRVLEQFHLGWNHCLISWCLIGMALLALLQIVPLPRGLLDVISPATGRLYHRLLPAEAEQLPAPVTRPEITTGSTISVYPYGTRQELVRLLAMLTVFFVVRNCLASAASLWRLSVAAVVVGLALSLFALIQFFTSAPNVIYWCVPTEGAVFGPFICRNHFPFFLNLCFGLGLGLLCSWLIPRNRSSSARHLPEKGAADFRIFEMLQQPKILWLSFSLILMATSIVFSASRGGALAFLGGAAVCLILVFLRSSGFVPLKTSLLIAVGSLALLAWFGLERVQARFGTLLQGQVGAEDRISLLSRAPALVMDYPIWGTGLGSLDFVEPIYRTDAADAGWAYQHAHNEYLEALIEGGLVRFALTVLLIGLITRQGFRAFRLLAGTPAAGLVLGGLFGFTTLVLHSFVDFGIHIPAIALLAAVLCAQLTALGDPDETKAPPAEVPENGRLDWSSWIRRGLLPLLGAAAFASLGWFLFSEGYRAAQVRRLIRAVQALKGATDPGVQRTRIGLLEKATLLDPGNARLQFELGEKHASLYESLAQKEADQETMLNAVQAVLLTNPGCSAASGASGTTAFIFVAKIHQERRKRVLRELGQRHVVLALRHYLLARDLCPARAKAHMEIAAHVEFLAKAEPRRNYLERALFLDPAHPELWYRAGVLSAHDGQLDQACKDWRRSLELSDLYLKKILDRSIGRVDSQKLIDQILPERPGILVAAAAHLYPKTDAPQRRPFLEKTRLLHQTMPGPWPADDLRLKAFVLSSLGHSKESMHAYKEALALKPMQLEWRLELAKLLMQQEQYKEAKQELQVILSVQPRHGAARDLLARVERERTKR